MIYKEVGKISEKLYDSTIIEWVDGVKEIVYSGVPRELEIGTWFEAEVERKVLNEQLVAINSLKVIEMKHMEKDSVF